MGFLRQVEKIFKEQALEGAARMDTSLAIDLPQLYPHRALCRMAQFGDFLGFEAFVPNPGMSA